MGGLFSKPKVPSPPPAPEAMDVIDTVAGIEQIIETRTGADGKKRKVIVRRELPKTAEEIAQEQQLQRLVNENLETIERLSSVDLAIDIPEFQEAVTDLRTTLTKSTDEVFRRRARFEEEVLAQRGIAESTAGTEVRAERGKQFGEAQTQIESATRLEAENLRAQAIGRSQNLLALASGQLQQQQGRVAQAFQGANVAQQGLLSAQSQAQQAQFAGQVAAFNAAQNARSGIFSSLTGLASLGTLALGPAGFGLFGAGAAGGAATAGGAAAAGGAGAFTAFSPTPFAFTPSDVRIKENIEVIGKLENGLTWYAYNYIGSNVRHEGVMAQDVEQMIPEAVLMLDGIKYVNYSMIK